MLYIVKQQVAVEADGDKQAHDLAETPILEQMRRNITGPRIVSTEVLKIKKVKP